MPSATWRQRFNGNVTIALATGSGGVTLSGTTAVTAVQGVAAFTGLALDTVGTNYTLQVSSGMPDRDDQRFERHTGCGRGTGRDHTTAGDRRPPAASFGLTVSVEDAFGNLATTFNGSVTVAVAAAPGGVALSGTTTITAVQGVAAFTGLALDTAGSGYTLQASGHGLTSTTTTAFSVTAGASRATGGDNPTSRAPWPPAAASG